jgi:predicted phosphoadenosine phosphosulfate sulfurtransferase
MVVGSRGARRLTGANVYDAAIGRLVEMYDRGHTVVVSVSGGKDSGVCLELAIVAATMTGRLPVLAVSRDEEIIYPGTPEYLDRVAARPDVKLDRYLVPRPIVNVFNRAAPYYWPFDDQVDPDLWVRPPPADAIRLAVTDHPRLTTPERYPADPGRETIVVLGLRVAESRARMYGLFSSGGYLMKPDENGVRAARVIYDWSDGDVWLGYKRFGWDHNRAYSDLARMGVPRGKLRVAPPAMNAAGAALLPIAARTWPGWFARVARRLPGIKQGAMYGRRAVTPQPRPGETWESCFKRVCTGPDVPEWIRTRAQAWADKMNSHHRHHSAGVPFPDVQPCHTCDGNQGSWRTLTLAMWNGDPTSVFSRGLPEIPPEFFRPGAGTWPGIKERY